MLVPKTLPIPACLNASSLEQAAELLGPIDPWTYLLCASGNVENAEKALKGWTGIRINIAPAEALGSPDSWMLMGPDGVVWSGRV
jgi:hypothetical protein